MTWSCDCCSTHHHRAESVIVLNLVVGEKQIERKLDHLYTEFDAKGLRGHAQRATRALHERNQAIGGKVDVIDRFFANV
jgi:hypothetical protein